MDEVKCFKMVFPCKLLSAAAMIIADHRVAAMRYHRSLPSWNIKAEEEDFRSLFVSCSVVTRDCVCK